MVLSSASFSSAMEYTTTKQLTDGRILPSDHAYVDVFHYTQEGKINLNAVSIHTDQDQSFNEDTQTSDVKFHHRLMYKGDTIWELTTTTTANSDGILSHPSDCKISRGRLYVKLYRSKSFLGKAFKKIKDRKVYDINAIIIGSAAAYQIEATEEEYGQHRFIRMIAAHGVQLNVSDLGSHAQSSVVQREHYSDLDSSYARSSIQKEHNHGLCIGLPEFSVKEEESIYEEEEEDTEEETDQDSYVGSQVTADEETDETTDDDTEYSEHAKSTAKDFNVIINASSSVYEQTDVIPLTTTTMPILCPPNSSQGDQDAAFEIICGNA